MSGTLDVLQRAPAAAALLEAARSADMSLEGAWLVGGAVRDALLGRPGLDLDIAIEGDGVQFADDLAQHLGGEVLARHAFGTATVRVPTMGEEALTVDVASARTETYAQPGALPTVTLGAAIDQDLSRRDFTVNALAFALDGSGRLLQAPGVGGGGTADLDDQLVRVLHARSFRDDPTRVLRAVRYAARLGFALESQTRDVLQEAVADGALGSVSGRRIGAELQLLAREKLSLAVAELDATGVLAWLDPRIGESAEAVRRLLVVIDQEWGGTPERSSLAWHMRVAALAAPLGRAAAGEWLQRWDLTRQDIRSIAGHVALLELVRAHDVRIAGASVEELLDLVGTDDQMALSFASLAAGPEAGAAIARYAAAVSATQLEVTGHDLLALGVERGPAVGYVLDELYRSKLRGELATIDDERALVRTLVRDGGGR